MQEIVGASVSLSKLVKNLHSWSRSHCLSNVAYLASDCFLALHLRLANKLWASACCDSLNLNLHLHVKFADLKYSVKGVSCIHTRTYIQKSIGFLVVIIRKGLTQALPNKEHRTFNLRVLWCLIVLHLTLLPPQLLPVRC